MNEIALSDDLNQIELEIKHHKNIAGQSIWEIGRRLNHVKENDLAHGEFAKWLKKVEIEQSTANRFMKVAEEIPYSAPVQNLGYSVLYLIATLPEEQKEMELEKANQGEPSTRRELEEIKRKNREQEKIIEELKNKEPEVIEKEVVKEVKPYDYDGLKSDNIQLEQVNRRLRNEIEILEESNKSIEKNYQDLLEQRADVDEKSKKYDELTEQIEELAKQKNRQAQQVETIKDFNLFKRNVNELLVKLSPIIYKDDIELLEESGITLNHYKDLVEKVQSWCDDMNRKLEEPKIIEGVYIDE